MALAVDSTSSKLNDATSVTTLTMSHTCSGSDRLLIVAVPRSRGVTCSVTYNGVSMTSAVSINNGNSRAQIFYLIAPTTGANNIVVTYSASNGSYTAAAVSFTGADQTDPIGASGTQTGTATDKSLSITTEADGSYLVDCIGSAGTVHTAGAGQTDLSAAANRVVSYKSAPTAGSNGTSWTGTPSTGYAYALLEILAAPVVTSPHYYYAQQQVAS